MNGTCKRCHAERVEVVDWVINRSGRCVYLCLVCDRTLSKKLLTWLRLRRRFKKKSVRIKAVR